MCVASPGRVIEINDNVAKIDYNGNIVNANIGIVDVKVGDYVLVHAGLVIQTLNESEATEMVKLFKMLEDI